MTATLILCAIGIFILLFLVWSWLDFNNDRDD